MKVSFSTAPNNINPNAPKQTYLKCFCSGTLEPTEVEKILHRIKLRAQQEYQTRVLADCVAVSAPKNELDRFLIGTIMGKILKPPLKTAIVYTPEYINNFAETVANNRGACVLVCDNEPAALEWLFEN